MMVLRIGLVALLMLSWTEGHADTLSLDELLAQVKAGRAADAEENAARLRAFESDKANQAARLAAMQQRRTEEESRSVTLEAQFEANDATLVELQADLRETLGALKELFGILQQTAGDARGQFENSPTQIQFPQRTRFLSEFAEKMGQSTRLASIEEMEQLWFELQREMTESGKVVQFPADVVLPDGRQRQQTVTRVGLFNVVSDGRYLRYAPESGRLAELVRQPPGRFLERAAALESADGGTAEFALDPTRGQLLSLLVQTPRVSERLHQGGIVGYLILALGVVALLIATERLITLGIVGARVAAQVETPQAHDPRNPLGRILRIYESNTDVDVESLELKLGEGILKETPKLNRRLALLKIIAVVAPLLGLLGTVTGMIITFQAITLYGTGDPRLMAGGISQALVTTVLGLCVAIPTVFLHTLAASRAKRVTQVLEEQAAGLIARRAEQRTRPAA